MHREHPRSFLERPFEQLDALVLVAPFRLAPEEQALPHQQPQQVSDLGAHLRLLLEEVDYARAPEDLFQDLYAKKSEAPKPLFGC